MTQPPDPKPSLNEQIANILLKGIMAGSITVGGFGAFWSLFKDSDVPKAIASAAIGLAISYAAKMLQPLHEGNQRRLERTGKAIDQGVEAVGDRILSTVLRGDKSPF